MSSFLQDRSNGKATEYKLADLLTQYNYSTTVVPLGPNSAPDITAVSSTQTLTFEVKADFKAAQTKNAAIEISRRSIPTGIMSCSADYWAHCINGIFYVYKTERLKCFSQNPKWEHRQAGDGMRTKVVLIPLNDFVMNADFFLADGCTKPTQL